VIGDHDNPVLVPGVAPQAFKHGLNTARPTAVMDHRKIDLANHDITCRDGRLPGGAGDQFSGKRYHEKTVA
jgi:hypothetical protein